MLPLIGDFFGNSFDPFYRLASLVEYTKDAIFKGVNDHSPYVRKAAIIGCLQLYKLAPGELKRKHSYSAFSSHQNFHWLCLNEAFYNYFFIPSLKQFWKLVYLSRKLFFIFLV